MPFPGRRDDFDTEEAYHRWRTQELAHISQLMLAMIQLKPNLARPMPSESSAQDPSLQRPLSGLVLGSSEFGGNLTRPANHIDFVTSDDDIEAGHNFSFVPPNPKKAYKRLVELCLERDLEAMVHLPEDQEVSLTIISHQHLELLNETALRWRISHFYRITCFLDVVRYKYERDEVPIECIPEGLLMVDKAMHDVPLEFWPRFDVSTPGVLRFDPLIIRFIQDGLCLDRVWGPVQYFSRRPIRSTGRCYKVEAGKDNPVCSGVGNSANVGFGRALQGGHRRSPQRPSGSRSCASCASIHGQEL